MRIGQLARQAGVGVETIRFYEREGLLDKPRRRASGYRVYTPEFVDRIRLIKEAQHLGFSLREIRELLILQASGSATAANLKQVVDAKLTEINDRLGELHRMRSGLQRLSKACSGQGPVRDFPLLGMHLLCEDGAG